MTDTKGHQVHFTRATGATNPARGHILVNHVMSNSAKSRIFDDFIAHFRRHSPIHLTHVVSVKPVESASVYHYHRPNLESSALPRSVVTVHHHLEDNDPWLDFSKFAEMYKQSEQIVCLSNEQSVWLQQRGYQRTTIIPHGVDDRFTLAAKSEAAKIRLGLASRRYARRVKGEVLLEDIAKRLPKERFSFVLIGAGRTQDASLLDSLGFEIAAYEFLPYRLFPKFYTSIDALLVLSFYEGGPACVPEAIATGTPVFSTPVGMSLDMIKPGENGELLTREPDKDVATLVRFATDEDYQKSLIKGSRNLAGTALSWKQVVERYTSVYEAVADA